jgi:hypothetical protein
MAFVLWRSLSERVTQLGRMCTTKAQILILNDTYAHSNAILAVVCKCTSVLLLVVTVRLLYMRTDASEPCRKLVNQDVPYICGSICSLICFHCSPTSFCACMCTFAFASLSPPTPHLRSNQPKSGPKDHGTGPTHPFRTVLKL